MKSFVLSLFVALLGLGFVAADAEAKRLGGGGSSGMQRQMPAKPAPGTPPSQQSAGPAAATPPAAAPGRSWLGPIAGIAAGLGLAALMSHLGFGAEFGNLVTLLLLGVVAFVAIRFLLRRFAPAATPQRPQGLQFAGAGGVGSAAPDGAGPAVTATAAGTGSASPATPTPSLPPGFDAAGFERIAKLIFIRLQAANDHADLDDLRQFATPEMFAVFKLDLQDRANTAQRTDVVQLDAEVLDFAQEAARQVVSVRFHGLIREEKDGPAAPFDEVWHLVKPIDGSQEWAIAGIAQMPAA